MEHLVNGVELELYSERILTENPHVGMIKMFDGTLRETSYHILDGLVIIEGDIVLGDKEEVLTNIKEPGSDVTIEAIIIKPLNKWPNKTVYYEISDSLPNQNRVLDAFKEWQNKTGMKFVKRTTQPNYVSFIRAPEGGSCYSTHTGMSGRRQEVGLGDNCSTGNAIHEIAHVIGFWHEQSRKDRDNFVTIHLENVLSGYEHNFDKHISDGQDVGTYDYGSIMHYPRKAFTKNDKDTIVPKDPNAQIGQRVKLSARDIQTINIIYN